MGQNSRAGLWRTGQSRSGEQPRYRPYKTLQYHHWFAEVSMRDDPIRPGDSFPWQLGNDYLDGKCSETIDGPEGDRSVIEGRRSHWDAEA